jgi:cell wall-associated NlpC family hydrolase
MGVAVFGRSWPRTTIIGRRSKVLPLSVRDGIVAAARWGIGHERQIHYGEVRPIPLARMLPLTTDCSGFVTLCYFLAGAPDPNGLGYSGEGWTGTILRHLASIAPVDARRGDLVVWGDYPGRHVSIVLEPGHDPLLCSHGQERGPLAVRFSDEDRWQACASTWLDGLSRSSRPLRPE